MLKWLVTLAVVMFALGLAGPLLPRPELGRLTGDFSVLHRDRRFYFPVATGIGLSLALMLALQVLRI